MILEDYILEVENVIPDEICDSICDNGITDNKSFSRALIHDGIEDETRNCLVKTIDSKYTKNSFNVFFIRKNFQLLDNRY